MKTEENKYSQFGLTMKEAADGLCEYARQMVPYTDWPNETITYGCGIAVEVTLPAGEHRGLGSSIDQIANHGDT